MAVVKVSENNKKEIDQLQAKLTLQLGRKVTKQETLDICIQLAKNKYEDLLKIASDVPMLTPDIVDKILRRKEENKNLYYNVNEQFYSENDTDAYSI